MIYRSFTPAPPAYSISTSPLAEVPLDTAFEISQLQQFDINQSGAQFSLNVARYQDNSGESRRAIVYRPPTTNITPILNLDDLRYQIWSQAFHAIQQHVKPTSLLISWWDNAQRLHLFTGVNTWSDRPIAELYAVAETRKLWQDVSGGFAKNDANIKQLARWLTMDAEQALQEIKATTDDHKQVYLLLSADDLARIQEIEQASGTSLALESQVFYHGDNIHSQIARVKQWARETGTGSYLLQPLPGVGVRAWRSVDQLTQNSLLVRLLPFTQSLQEPLAGVNKVFQSEWGGYISIFAIEQD